MKQKMIIIGLAMGLTMVSQQTQSLGMGKIQVHSALDQPLQANIDLMMGEGDDFSEITVAIASAADYKKVGLDRSFVPNNIQVALDEENPLTINVTSSGPISEPIVSLLLDVNWGNGRILREFTILLDPPVYQSSQSVIVNSYQDTDNYEDTSATTEPEEVETQVSEPTVQTREEAQQADVSSEAEASVSEESDTDDVEDTEASEPVYQANFGDITVESGDTLWSLANTNKPGNISTHQMMMALFNKNPNAFANNNINQLNKGSVLSIPTLQDIEQLSQTEAMRLAQSHNDTWSPATTDSSDYSSFQTTSDYSELAADDTSSIDYGVELSGGDDSQSSDGDGDSTGISTSDDAMAEELYNTTSENTELKDRVNELESLVEQQQAALEVKSDDMANLEEQMATANDTETDAVETDDVWGDELANQDTTTDSNDELSIGEVSLVEGSETEDGAMTGAGFESTDADSADSVEDAAEQTDDADAEPAQPAVNTTPSFSGAQSAQEPSMVDTAVNWVMDNLRWVLMGLVGLLLLIFVPRLVSGRNKDVAEETSFLDDIKSRKRSDDEESEVTETLADDTKVNEPLSEDLLEGDDDDVAEDDVLAELDKKIDFDADMDDEDDIFKGFDDEESQEAVEEEDEDHDDDGFDLDGFLSDEIDESDESNESAGEDEESLFDESLDDVITKDLSEEASQASEQAEGLDDDFDFDLSELDGLEDEGNKAQDELASEIDDAVSEMTGEDSDESEDEDMDFSLDDESFELDLDEEAVEEAVEEGVSSVDEFDEMLDINEDAAEDLQVESEETIDDSDLDLGLDLDDMMEDGDVIDTKMDLAKAYLEMGDNDGARNLLKEVAAEGNESQIEEAKKLLDDM